MFNPNQLIYRGRQQGIDVFDYNGIRIDATVANELNGQYLYLGFGKGLPDSIMPGLMAQGVLGISVSGQELLLRAEKSRVTGSCPKSLRKRGGRDGSAHPAGTAVQPLSPGGRDPAVCVYGIQAAEHAFRLS